MSATFTDAYAYITLNATEKELFLLEKAIKGRTSSLQLDRASSFRVGARVETTGPLSPRYLLNRMGTITKINKSTMWVSLDNPVLQGRFYGSKTLRFPISCLKLVDQPNKSTKAGDVSNVDFSPNVNFIPSFSISPNIDNAEAWTINTI